jgi:hypothetical protein
MLNTTSERSLYAPMSCSDHNPGSRPNYYVLFLLQVSTTPPVDPLGPVWRVCPGPLRTCGPGLPLSAGVEGLYTGYYGVIPGSGVFIGTFWVGPVLGSAEWFIRGVLWTPWCVCTCREDAYYILGMHSLPYGCIWSLVGRIGVYRYTLDIPCITCYTGC